MICPRCGTGGMEKPRTALSRRDNKTHICPECGQEEAMIDAGLEVGEEAFKFEKDFCRRLKR